MNTVKVSAEHDYEVLIGCDWSSVLVEKIHNRTRVAVIVSAQYFTGSICSARALIAIFMLLLKFQMEKMEKVLVY
jgi:hypothetical protein